MLKVKNDTIMINRGDIGTLGISIPNGDANYIFKIGDVVRFSIIEAKNYSNIIKQIDVIVEEETEEVDINLLPEHTKIGDVINSKVDYYYEVELNPDTAPQTIIGHDDKGAKLFVLYPEGEKNNDQS